MRGLRLVTAQGERSALIEGTPAVYDDGQLSMGGVEEGLGWLLDVAPHPRYRENGWIYLHFGDRCKDCDTSMNKLIRGRIENGRWIDEETIWQADPVTYTGSPDMGAGGRISFDGRGHVFLSVGIKGHSNHHGIQDLSLPYGKVHRVHDDGRIPSDNPFLDIPGALAEITREIAEAAGNIVEVQHYRAFTNVPVRSTEVEFVLQTRGVDHAREIVDSLRRAGYVAYTLEDDLASAKR